MFKTLQHLLPKGQAFLLTAGSNIERMMQGLGNSFDSVRTFLNGVYLQINPETTTSLDEWEPQFGLTKANLNEAERRVNLLAAWRATGGQSPKYIQDTLRSAGFDVYVYEAWVPGTEPAVGVNGTATYRNPFTYLQGSTDGFGFVQCGESFAQCGEPIAQCGNFESTTTGFPLVNKILRTTASGADYQVVYTIPPGAQYWPFFIYIGGTPFGTLLDIPPARREEFEALVLKIVPLHLWVGLLTTFVGEDPDPEPDPCGENLSGTGPQATGYEFEGEFEPYYSGDQLVYIGRPPGETDYVGYWKVGPVSGTATPGYAAIEWHTDAGNPYAAYKTFTFRIRAVKNPRAAQVGEGNLPSDQVLTTAYVDVNTATWAGANPSGFWIPGPEVIVITPVLQELFDDDCWVNNNYPQLIFEDLSYPAGDGYVTFGSYVSGEPPLLTYQNNPPVVCGTNYGNTGGPKAGYDGETETSFDEDYPPNGLVYVGISPGYEGIYHGLYRPGPVVADIGDTVSATLTWATSPTYPFTTYKTVVLRIHCVKDPRAAIVGLGNLPKDQILTDAYVEIDTAEWDGSVATDYWRAGPEVIDVSPLINELLADPCWVSGNLPQFIIYVHEFTGEDGYVTYNGIASGAAPAFSYTVL